MKLKYIKHSLLYLILIILLQDSFFKLYKGATHRFIYPNNKEIASTSMEKWILEGREEAASLNNRLLSLNNETKHFYRIFIPQNHYLYLSGILQQYKIYEAVIYESSISKELQDFYDYVVLRKNSLAGKELKYAMPYFLFTRHVHSGLNLAHTEIPYNDFFMFSPADIKKIQKQNIEFMWDVMQIKYLIIESELSAAIESFANKEDYKLIGKYHVLNLNLYEINKSKNYGKLAIFPLETHQSYDKAVEQLNSNDINVLKEIYSKLVFFDQKKADFILAKTQSYSNKRYYEVSSKQKAILIDFESWNHNWNLKVNEESQKLLKAFHIFKGIEIKPGLNRIEITYQLKYFKKLFLLSILIILIYIILLGRCYYIERNNVRRSNYV